MSVAFRRESDDEHKEPKFELPIPPGLNLVTPRGLALIEARVAELEGIAAASDEQKRDLRYWRARLATAQLAPPPPADQIAFGSRVRLTLNGKDRAIELVGDDEADPEAGERAGRGTWCRSGSARMRSRWWRSGSFPHPFPINRHPELVSASTPVQATSPALSGP